MKIIDLIKSTSAVDVAISTGVLFYGVKCLTRLVFRDKVPVAAE